MSKSAKVLLVIFVPILIVLAILYSLINAVYVPKPDPVAYPQGELTDSIFTEQNNNYEKNDAFKNKHEFKEVPYTIDIMEGDGAQVGSGTIYKIDNSDSFFLYLTEYDDTTNAQDIIASQFPAVLLINYIPEMTMVTVQVDKRGFINGFSAEYIAETIVAGDGTMQKEAAVLGYALDVPGVDYAGRHIFVGVGTTEISTENLQACQDFLGQVMKTITKDDKLEEARLKEAEQQAEEAEEAALKAAEAGAKAAAQAQSLEQQEQSVPQVATIPIPIDKQFSNLKINVEWTNYNPNAVLELFNPQKTMYFDPSYQNDMGAGFVIPDGEVGTYELHIMNAAECGSIRTSHSGAEIETGGYTSQEKDAVSQAIAEAVSENGTGGGSSSSSSVATEGNVQ